MKSPKDAPLYAESLEQRPAFETATDAVLRVVSEYKGCDRLDLPVLYETIDGDSLNRFMDHASDEVVVEFFYADLLVRVQPERIELAPAEGTRDGGSQPASNGVESAPTSPKAQD